MLHVWQEQYHDLGRLPDINHVLIFENKGEVVGVSNPYPHCQIYATNFVFKMVETEARMSQRYLEETGSSSGGLAVGHLRYQFASSIEGSTHLE